MKETVLGIQVNTESYDELLPKVFDQIEKQQKSLIVAINPEKIIKAKEDPALKTLLNNAEFQIPDGIGVILASKIQKGQITSRVTGVDMMLRLCEEAARRKSLFSFMEENRESQIVPLRNYKNSILLSKLPALVTVMKRIIKKL